MIAPAHAFPLPPPREDLHARFLTVLPRIERHAGIVFRSIGCAHQRQECIAETIALAWMWYCRLADRGRDAAAFVTVLASLAARAVRSGRRACGQEKARDVLSRVAQRRHQFRVESLPVSTHRSMADLYASVNGQRQLDSYEESLKDDTRTPIPDQAAFRIDFPDFLKTLSGRDRRLVKFLALGHSARKAARRFHLTAGRVTQLRVRWCREWYARHGERAPFEDRRSKTRLVSA
jgi:hypothetical protein